METTEASKIELILGDAVRLLVESGASASIVGPFALKFGAKVAQRLAVPEALPPPSLINQPDIQSLIRATVDDAVAKTLLGTQQLIESDSKKVRMKVGKKGAVTTVTLPQSVLTKSIEHWGGKRPANAAIRQLYELVPSSVGNKSRWVTSELQKLLSPSVAR